MTRPLAGRFEKSFTRQEPISPTAVASALAVLESGRLHRYDLPPDGGLGEVSSLELEFARYQGQAYCLACASGGYALQLALRATGVAPGDSVLTNAFTLSPVPGAIAALGARPRLVECGPELTLDLEHLERLAAEGDARVLLLSHMRGHIADMHRVRAIVDANDMLLIEDCAHTMGATFDERRSGAHGDLACFSTQTYKHLNSGEGGLVTGDDPTLVARAILLSGSYMLYERHGAAPAAEVFEPLRLDTPNCSGRMDELRAAIIRPQLARLDENAARWNERHLAMHEVLESYPGIRQPIPHPAAREVSSSIQFFTESLDDTANERFLARCAKLGVGIKWFGRAEPVAYTSRHESWRYVAGEPMPATAGVLHRLHDCRIPLTFTVDDCRHVATIIGESFEIAAATV